MVLTVGKFVGNGRQRGLRGKYGGEKRENRVNIDRHKQLQWGEKREKNIELSSQRLARSE